MVRCGEPFWLGTFDQDGNFLREPHCQPSYTGMRRGVLRTGFTVSFRDSLPVYEHRSGRLISGTWVQKPTHYIFVPEVGSTVTELAKFDLKNPDRMVWNLVETIPAYWTEERKKQFPNGLPTGPEPPAVTIPAGDFLPFSLSHPGKPPKHARAIRDVVEFGHLSDEGEFIPDPDLPVVSRDGIKGPVGFDTHGVPRYYTVPQLDRFGKLTTENVYEFRSGRLIKGTLHASGNFVPELGSKVIEFKDYDYFTEHRRIYNLPGKLIRIK